MAAACRRDGALAAPPTLRAAAAWLGRGGAPPLPPLPPPPAPPLPPRGWLWGAEAGAVEKVACLGRTGFGLGSRPGGSGWIDREVAGRPMLAECAAGSTVLPMLLPLAECGRGGCGCCRGGAGCGCGAARGGTSRGAGGCGGGRGAGGGGSSSSVRSMNTAVDIACLSALLRPCFPASLLCREGERPLGMFRGVKRTLVDKPTRSFWVC